MSWDVIVIGSGLAGSIGALRAAEQGRKVLLIEGDSECASAWAQGGIVYPREGDFESLIQDIFAAGCGINNPVAVETVVKDGSKLVPYWLLDRAKVSFDRDAKGDLDWALEAAHSRPRILHVKDQSGRAIMDKLRVMVASHPLIERKEGLLVDLLVSDRHDLRSSSVYKTSCCAGAYIFLRNEQRVEAFVAPAVLLATGGFSGLFEHSTGARSLRGDGIAAAHRAGARTLHLEYVQFHPTSLYIPNERRYLLTEALRGEGAKLLRMSGERFVDELAARDVVARAIHETMLHDGSEHVWLDCRGIKNFADHFPGILSLLEQKGLDPTLDLIPVVPSAHYTLGGVWTDSVGGTSLPGLFAAGEVACTGLHGANRLASTSLLEALVYGHRSADAAHVYLSSLQGWDFQAQPWVPGEDEVDPALLSQDWQLLRRTLWNYVGLTRYDARLKRAERMLLDLRRDVESFYKRGKLSESLIGLRHAVQVATLILYAALRNPHSLGTHHLDIEAQDRI
ncbi:MAG: FAD-dependent oxidoreductase [Bdellovibrionota bacterium]